MKCLYLYYITLQNRDLYESFSGQLKLGFYLTPTENRVFLSVSSAEKSVFPNLGTPSLQQIINLKCIYVIT